MNYTIFVNFISATEAVDLRSRILRPGQPIQSCIYPGDNDAGTFHIGVVIDARIVSNGTFVMEKNDKFPEAEISYRLRGMATDTRFQNMGFGKLIIKAALLELQKRNCELIWFNARVFAEGFYEKMGFLALPEVFDIPLAGPHKVMYKWCR